MIKELCAAIEEKTCRKMDSNQDFEWLANDVEDKVHTAIGVNTLKRMWGYYIDQTTTPRKGTLDVLAKYLGYENFDVFALSINPEFKSGQSHFVFANKIDVNNLQIQDVLIRLSWLPDRFMSIRHQGKCKFVIEEVENSKLSVGDTFECQLIIAGEPLYLGNLIHHNSDGTITGPVSYVAGKNGGVRFELEEDFLHDE